MRRSLIAAAAASLLLTLAFVASPPAHAATTERIAGNDRYETSAKVSASAVPAGRSVVYVASGTDYPDALAAAPVAGARDTSVLLVTRDSIPASIKTELTRIKPPTIHVVGGSSSVSDAVLTELKKYATNVDRISGATRYDTAAAISKSWFAPQVAFVYVVTGESFPDALAAGAAAVDRGAVLLTRRDSIPPGTATELQRLKPQEIIVVGGTSAISSGVETSLDQYTTGPVTRQAGKDRYATSAVVSSKAFQAPTDAAYLASGASFADALSGGPIAGANDGPILLVQRTCITEEVSAELSRLENQRTVLLGGTGVIADGAEKTTCSTTTTTTSSAG